MKDYSVAMKSAVRKIKYKNNHEVSNRLTPKERQALAITYSVPLILILIVLVTYTLN